RRRQHVGPHRPLRRPHRPRRVPRRDHRGLAARQDVAARLQLGRCAEEGRGRAWPGGRRPQGDQGRGRVPQHQGGLMAALIVSPDKNFTGTVAGVEFVDGTATTSDTWALAYFERHGYRIEAEGWDDVDLSWTDTADLETATVDTLRR